MSTEVFFAPRVDITSKALRRGSPVSRLTAITASRTAVTQNSLAVRPLAADKTPLFAEGASVGETESRSFVIPAGAGRSVRLQIEVGAESIQLAIISTRGNAMESVSLDEGQLQALVGALEKAQAEAHSDLLTILEQSIVEREQRHKEALARNPWLNGEREEEKHARYIRRPR